MKKRFELIMFAMVPYNLTVFSPEDTAAEIEGRVPVPVIVELVPVRILFKSEFCIHQSR